MMMQHQVLRATYMPAAEFEAVFGEENSVQSEARRLIDEAQKVAADLCRAVEREHAAIDQRLSEISKSELEAFLDKERIAYEAEAFAALLDASAQVKRGFDALQPWLSKLVETAVTRIIGSFDDDELIARLVAEGIREIDPGQHVALRVAPDCLGRVTAAKQALPQRFAAVASITADPALGPGEMLLDSAGGFVEITLRAQIDAVMSCVTAKSEAGKP
jgi:flagellar biosynthesis/type III secretory pathway protein FliH